MSTVNKINQFWSWFSDVNKELDSNELTVNDTLTNEINSKVKSIHSKLQWELGVKEFIISPGGDKNLIPLCEKIINKKPHLVDWDISIFKKRKGWQSKIEIFSNKKKYEINFDPWVYSLSQYDDGMIDIFLYPPDSLYRFNLNLVGAAVVLVEYMLGEKMLIEKINEIQVLSSFGSEDDVTPCRYLYDHINSLD